MHLDTVIIVAGFLVGIIVGLTGVGGGSLTTPILVLLLGVQPLAAVASDLVASLVMKPFGSLVHAMRGTIHTGLVLWLALGSVPGALLGPLLLHVIGHGPSIQSVVKVALGCALILAAGGMFAKAVLSHRRQLEEMDVRDVRVKRVATTLIGLFGGVVVGMTSVGSGSLMIVFLLVLYPRLRARSLVGTDLAQAIPMVGAAALGHVLLFGDLQVNLTLSLIIGGVPGIFIGARLSSGAPNTLVRNSLIVVVFVSGLKQLGTPTIVVGFFLVVALVVGLALGGVSLARRSGRYDQGQAEQNVPAESAAER